MKKFSLFTLFVFAVSFEACLFAGCSDTTAMGTSEEGNEMAEYVSSSSEESSSSEKIRSDKSSSSTKSSSSLAKSSSSFTANEPEMSSSSVKLLSSSSEKEHNNQSRSSSSVRDVQIPISSSSSVVRSSSSEDPPNPQEGTAKPTTLDSYLEQFKLQSGSFDEGVLSAKIDNGGKVSTPYEGDKPPTSAVDPEYTELYRFDKKNIGEIDAFFPTAAKKYAEIVSAIKNGSVESDCGLYMLSIVGNKKVAGFVLAGIAKDSLTLLDIPAGSCPSTAGKMSQFLFYYCGELIREPEIVHVPVEDNLSTKCADIKTQTEWLKGSSLTP